MDGNSSDDFGLTFWWGPGHAVITDQEARDLGGESVTVGQGGGIEMGRNLGDMGWKKEEAVCGSAEVTFKGR